MKKVKAVNLDKLIEDFSLLEQKITELQGKNNILDIKLDEASRLLKLGQTKETCMKEAEMKETELKDAIVRKEAEIQAMKKQLKDQEREKQSEIIKLQMEFNAKLARIQSTSVKAQHQDPSILAQNIFKRKLQFLQEEKNRETEALRRTIKELEQQLNSPHDSHLKRRRSLQKKRDVHNLLLGQVPMILGESLCLVTLPTVVLSAVGVIVAMLSAVGVIVAMLSAVGVIVAMLSAVGVQAYYQRVTGNENLRLIQYKITNRVYFTRSKL
ncbi:UNVERIFIED_CONTAM: hypothetical protein FKN15_014722 [Acipenser sinensis]